MSGIDPAQALPSRPEAPTGRGPVLDRALPALVLGTVALTYLASLTGGFVWDDHGMVEHNLDLHTPLRLLTTDIAGGDLPQDVPLYRPLVMLSFAVVQALWPGPLLERLVNLGMFLGILALAASVARAAGASRAAAWSAVWLFGVHPAGVEAVAWISGRHELLPTLLMLLAWVRLPRHPLSAGLLLALTPFAKESWLVAPAATLLLYPLFGRVILWPSLLAAMGDVGSVWVRARVGEALPVEAAGHAPVAALGGAMGRGLEVLFLPARVGPTPLLHEDLVLGTATLLLALLLVALSFRWRALAFLTAAGVFLAPAAVAADQFGVPADRYYLVPLLGAALALSLPLTRLPSPLPVALLVVPLAALSTSRAAEWTSDVTLFRAALARQPGNPDATFYLGAALQDAGACAEALPLLQASGDDPRALPRILACHVELGDYAAAIALTPWASSATAYEALARAHALQGDLPTAEGWARRATDARPQSTLAWTLLGNLLGQQGRLVEAGAAFERALQADPANTEAAHGVAAVKRRLAATR